MPSLCSILRDRVVQCRRGVIRTWAGSGSKKLGQRSEFCLKPMTFVMLFEQQAFLQQQEFLQHLKRLLGQYSRLLTTECTKVIMTTR
jgi:hypothetical protein